MVCQDPPTVCSMSELESAGPAPVTILLMITPPPPITPKATSKANTAFANRAAAVPALNHSVMRLGRLADSRDGSLDRCTGRRRIVQAVPSQYLSHAGSEGSMYQPGAHWLDPSLRPPLMLTSIYRHKVASWPMPDYSSNEGKFSQQRGRVERHRHMQRLRRRYQGRPHRADHPGCSGLLYLSARSTRPGPKTMQDPARNATLSTAASTGTYPLGCCSPLLYDGLGLTVSMRTTGTKVDRGR